MDGRQFIVELREDHTLVEALQDAPNDTWGGTWSRGRSSEKALDDMDFTIGLKIGKYLTMLKELDDGRLVGIERNYASNSEILVPDDGRQTTVELFRI